DGSIGFDTSKLIATETDTAGLKLYKDSDGALYIKKEDDKFLSITNEWGGTESFDFSSMDKDENYGESAKAYAVAKVTENNKSVYKIAVKYTMKTSLNGEVTENSMWEVLTASEEGVINFDQASWGSISPWEERFGQDMNGDGSIGFNLSSLTLLDTDSQGAIVKIDQDKGVYIFDSINSTDYYTVQDQWGGTPSFDHQATWEDGSFSSKTYAVEKQENGTYKLAVRQEDTIKNGDSVKSNVSWEVFTLQLVDGKLILDWETASTSSSIASQEASFNQDMNGDGAIGFNTSNFTEVATDTNGIKIYLEQSGAIFIKDSDKYIAITDDNGSTPAFNYSDNWGDSSFVSLAYALEKQGDGTYRLAVKQTETWTNPSGNSETRTVWNIHTISSTGTFSWEQSSYLDSIVDAESTFGQDLNGDGGIGFNVRTLANVITDSQEDASNQSTTYIKKSADNALYIIMEGAEPVKVTDENGYAANFFYNDSWTTQRGTEEHSSSAYAAEAILNDANILTGYLVAVKHIHKTPEGETFTDWEILKLNNQGQFDWESVSRSPSILAFESQFKQDLNGDGGIGLTADILIEVSTDTLSDQSNISNAFLKKDSDNALYIILRGLDNPIRISDPEGGSPTFDYAQSFGKDSFKSQSYAVELQGDGTFQLAIKREETFNGNDEINWEIFSLDSNGVISWEDSIWISEISNYEPNFNQDLNGDGAIGFDSSSLTLIDASPSNDSLKNDDSNNLFIITSTGSTIQIIDFGGGPIRLKYAESGTEGNTQYSYQSDPYALTNVTNSTDYLIAVKVTSLWDGETNTQWELQTVSSKGVLDWEKNISTHSISGYEEQFNQDLNGDGGIGAVRTAINTDSTGETLAKDSDNGLWIVDGSNNIVIREQYGGTPNFDYSETWGSFSRTSSAYAVAKQANGKYLLAIKIVDTDGDDSETFWETFQISSTGILDWDSGTFGSGVAKTEESFNQDLN
ncbi:hypothetical protein OAK69_01105, partial [bacterium]|nr:hypothetical protein [bacterium]